MHESVTMDTVLLWLTHIYHNCHRQPANRTILVKGAAAASRNRHPLAFTPPFHLAGLARVHFGDTHFPPAAGPRSRVFRLAVLPLLPAPIPGCHTLAPGRVLALVETLATVVVRAGFVPGGRDLADRFAVQFHRLGQVGGPQGAGGGVVLRGEVTTW